MKAEDLRLNNWVRCKIYNGNKDVYIQFTFQEAKYIHLFEPIELTTEILEKAGFKFIKLSGIGGQDQWAGLDIWETNLNGTSITFRGGRNGRFLILTGYFNCQINHVHQLQNLYFALTGTELKIKL